MAFGKRKKVEELDSSVDVVDVGVQPPVPPKDGPEPPVPSPKGVPEPPGPVVEPVDPAVESLVKDVQDRFGGLYGAGVSPGTVLAAEQATLSVAILAELRLLNDNISLLLVEVKKD